MSGNVLFLDAELVQRTVCPLEVFVVVAMLVVYRWLMCFNVCLYLGSIRNNLLGNRNNIACGFRILRSYLLMLVKHVQIVQEPTYNFYFYTYHVILFYIV